MNKRKTSRDIMADLLADKSAVQPPEDRGRKTSDDGGTVSQDEPKIKMTLSLPPGTADRLTRFETDMRLKTGERGHALAKSAIIATALNLLLEEYEQQGMESRLARQMDPNRKGRF